jgi:hypothetical protein
MNGIDRKSIAATASVPTINGQGDPFIDLSCQFVDHTIVDSARREWPGHSSYPVIERIDPCRQHLRCR